MKDQTQKSCTSESDQTDQYIWHSPLLQAVATLRASGQMFCADACQRLFTLLHTYDPTERDEAVIVERLIEKVDVEVSRKKQWDYIDKKFAEFAETSRSSGDTAASGSASTAPSGQQRRHCKQAAPLGGGIRFTGYDSFREIARSCTT